MACHVFDDVNQSIYLLGEIKNETHIINKLIFVRCCLDKCVNMDNN